MVCTASQPRVEVSVPDWHVTAMMHQWPAAMQFKVSESAKNQLKDINSLQWRRRMKTMYVN
jgi:hypothetical protein